MTNNTGNETDTAITVFADDSIKELLKSGKIEDIQKIVQEEEPSLSVNASCFSWQAGQIVGKYEISGQNPNLAVLLSRYLYRLRCNNL